MFLLLHNIPLVYCCSVRLCFKVGRAEPGIQVFAAMETGSSSSVMGAVKKAFITIGMMLFVMLAFRNSLVWYVAKIWSSSHDLWSYLWAAVFRASGESDFVMTVVCKYIIIIIII